MRDDRQRADDDRARQVALRVLHLAAGERQVAEAVVGPQHADQRQADAADADRRAGRRRRQVAETLAPWPPPSTSGRHTSSDQRRELGGRRDEPTIAAPRFTPTMLTTAAKAMAPADRLRAATECVDRIDAEGPQEVVAEHDGDAAERRGANQHQLGPAEQERRPAGPSLRAGRRRSRRFPGSAAASSASDSAPHSVMSAAERPRGRASTAGRAPVGRCRPASGRCRSRS